MINKKVITFVLSILALIFIIAIFGSINQINNTAANQFIEILNNNRGECICQEELKLYKEKIQEDMKIHNKPKNRKLNLYSLGVISYFEDDNEESLKYLNEAITYINENDYEKIDMLIYNEVALNYMNSDNLVKAQEYSKKAEEIGLKRGFNETLSIIYYTRAKALLNTDVKLVDVIDILKKSLTLANEYEIKVIDNIFLASLYRIGGLYELAMEHSIKAFELAVKNKDEVYKNMAIISLGENYYVQKDYEQLIYSYEGLLSNGKEIDVRNKLDVLGYLIEVYGEVGEYKKAEEYMYEYLDIANMLNEVDRVKVLTWIYIKYSNVKINEGKIDEALEYYNKGLEIYDPDKFGVHGYMNLEIAQVGIELDYEKNKDYNLALNRYEHILNYMNEIGIKADFYESILKDIVYISKENKDYETAVKYIEYIEKNYNFAYNNVYTNEILKNIEDSKYIEEIKLYRLVIACIALIATFVSGILIIVRRNNKRIKILNENLKEISIRDSLTKAYNKGYLHEVLSKDMDDKKKISFIMIDIDCFKQYNDNYGHVKGDEVLYKVANIIKDTFNEGKVFRFGGEEFAIIIEKDKIDVIPTIEDLMQRIAIENIKHEFSKVSDKVTLSIGIEEGKLEKKEDINNLIRKADNNLYKSKENGRNTYTY